MYVWSLSAKTGKGEGGEVDFEATADWVPLDQCSVKKTKVYIREAWQLNSVRFEEKAAQG